MKFIYSVLMAFLLLAGCGIEDRPTPAYPTAFQDGSEPDAVDAEELSLHNGVFAVNIKMVLFVEQKEQYPIVRAAFDAAIQQWADAIPVRFHLIEIGGEDAHNFRDVSHVIQIHIADLNGPEYMLPDFLYGMWEPDVPRIVLNGPVLEKDALRALGVSLHEIGHLLGLPHIVNHDENPLTGFVSLAEGLDAEELVMYPSGTSEPRISLTELEKKLARDFLFTYWANVNRAILASKCVFTVDK